MPGIQIDFSSFDPTQPFLLPVNSGCIATIEHIPFTETTKVDFVAGQTYNYYGIPIEVLIDWIQAPSVGKFFNQNIRNVYEYTEE